MTFEKIVTLKDGRTCLLRNGVASDGQVVLDVFNWTHDETDYLLTYSDENCFTASQEAEKPGIFSWNWKLLLRMRGQLKCTGEQDSLNMEEIRRLFV